MVEGSGGTLFGLLGWNVVLREGDVEEGWMSAFFDT